MFDTRQTRLLPITGTAMMSTFALFYLMQGLVASDMVELREAEPRIFSDVIFDDPEPPKARTRDRLKPPPEVLDQPPPVRPRRTVPTPQSIPVPPGPIPRPDPRDGEGSLPQFMDGDRIPIVRVSPVYPRVALERGLEGWVVLEFSITRDGMVENAIVVDSEPANIFNRAALAAVSKFKYKPAVVDGQAKPSHGVRFRMVFSLEE